MVPHHFLVTITVMIFLDAPSPFFSDHNGADDTGQPLTILY